jgi:nickel/cobalt transporter (NicO) family protein
MTALSQIFNAGAADAWLFVPSAIALGALHGLEPGHSKTMMAAFIVAVRGTVAQAALLGLAATASHTAVVWVVALGGLYLGAQWNIEANEPLLRIISGVLILAIALWMIWRSWRAAAESRHAHDHAAHDHGAHDPAAHSHAAQDHGAEQALPHHDDDHHHDHPPRGHGRAHDHHFPGRDPHVGRRRETGGYAARAAAPDPALVDIDSIADAHEREHALEINRRFAHRHVTTGQIVAFGLTGGLIPCPASVTVLLLCLQIGKIALGAVLVLSFSVGLALTMVAVGVGAALGMRHLSSRFSGLEAIAQRAPYVSGAIIALVGLYAIWGGVAEMAKG